MVLINHMKNVLFQKLSLSMKDAKDKLTKLTLKQKSALEKSWDVEHAYYSSTLEGSRLDRQDFEKLAEKIS